MSGLDDDRRGIVKKGSASAPVARAVRVEGRQCADQSGRVIVVPRFTVGQHDGAAIEVATLAKLATGMRAIGDDESPAIYCYRSLRDRRGESAEAARFIVARNRHDHCSGGDQHTCCCRDDQDPSHTAVSAPGGTRLSNGLGNLTKYASRTCRDSRSRLSAVAGESVAVSSSRAAFVAVIAVVAAT